MDLHIYPLLFSPIFKDRLWGGEELYDYLNVERPETDKPVGECWFIADRDDTQTKIANGPYEGLVLNDLISEYPAKFVGNKHKSSEKFPLLLTFHNVVDVEIAMTPHISSCLFLPHQSSSDEESGESEGSTSLPPSKLAYRDGIGVGERVRRARRGRPPARPTAPPPSQRLLLQHQQNRKRANALELRLKKRVRETFNCGNM